MQLTDSRVCLSDDTFSFGVVMFEMETRTEPYEHLAHQGDTEDLIQATLARHEGLQTPGYRDGTEWAQSHAVKGLGMGMLHSGW